MNCEDMQPLLPDYWDNTLDEADRLVLRQHLEQCPACRAEAEELQRVWTGLSATQPESPSGQMRERFYDRLEAFRQGLAEQNRAHPKRWFSAWHIPAPVFGAALLAAGFIGGYQLDHRRDSVQFSELRNEVGSMRQLVALSLLQQQNATDRLQGVNWAYRVEQPDTEVLSALLEAINRDPNVNVRLAAVDAMRKFSRSEVARRGLIQALPKQDSALVQIAIIDQLVDMKDLAARSVLRSLAADAKANDDVRQRAQWAIRQLQ
jgi:hypothetical protein